MSLTVLIDLDSVIVDLWTTWAARYNERTGDDLHVGKITDWGVSCAKNRGALFGVLQHPGFFASLQPFPGAVEGVEAIHHAGHRVVIVTAGRHYALADKVKWIEQHLPFIDPEKGIVLTFAKEMVRGDVLFDDGPHNVMDYRKAWPRSRIATIAYPYNRGAHALCDLVAGDYTDPAAAWARFVAWVKAGARRGTPLTAQSEGLPAQTASEPLAVDCGSAPSLLKVAP